MNMQPSEAEAGFNIRLTPTTDPDHLRKTIAEEWAPASRNLTFHVSYIYQYHHLPKFMMFYEFDSVI